MVLISILDFIDCKFHPSFQDMLKSAE